MKIFNVFAALVFFMCSLVFFKVAYTWYVVFEEIGDWVVCVACILSILAGIVNFIQGIANLLIAFSKEKEE